MSLSPTIPFQNQPQPTTPTLSAIVPTKVVETPLQTYRNEKYGFEFEYPTELNISESQNQDNIFAYYGPVQKYENLCQTTNLTISINGNEACGSLADKGVIPKIVESKFVWANQSTTLYDDYLDNKPVESRIDLIRNNKNQISASFIITPDNYNNLIIIRESFFKILSTFKFFDISSTSKTYTNMKYGFEFQYPSSLSVNTDTSQDSINIKLNDKIVFSLVMGESRVRLLNYEKNNNDKYVKNFSSLNIGTKSYPATNDYFAEGMYSGYGDCINENFNINYFVDIESTVLAMTSQSQESSCNQNGEKINVKPLSNTDINLTKKILSTFKFTKPNFCGGIAGVACPTGLKCILDGQYPDAGGKCQ